MVRHNHYRINTFKDNNVGGSGNPGLPDTSAEEAPDLRGGPSPQQILQMHQLNQGAHLSGGDGHLQGNDQECPRHQGNVGGAKEDHIPEHRSHD